MLARRACIAAAIGGLLGAVLAWPGTMAPPAGASSSNAARAKLEVVVEPSSTMSFLDDAIRGARHSIVLEMYELEDPTIETALVAAVDRHVAVRILLDHAGDGGGVNAPARAWLLARHVPVRWASSTAIFHEKAAVIDATTAYVGTGNLVAHDYATTRDFWVIDTQPADVAAIARTFDVDWTGAAPGPRPQAGDLVWSPGAKPAFLSLIDGAHHSIAIESEELSSDAIVDALCDAARRGVAVHVTMTYSSSWAWAYRDLLDAGAAVRVDYGESPVYIHAKALCVDCTLGAHPSGTVLVGSQNLGTASLDYNRELSIETGDAAVVVAIDTVLRHDFAAATPYRANG